MRPGSWVASSLDAADPPLPPDDEQLREEEEARLRAEEAAAAPPVTAEQTLALFDEMGMGCYGDESDDESEVDRQKRGQDEPEDQVDEAVMAAATAPLAAAVGRRPPAATVLIAAAGTDTLSSSHAVASASFLQPADGLVKEPGFLSQQSQQQQLAGREPQPEPEPGQPDKHGFVSSDGRGRGCAAIGGGVSRDKHFPPSHSFPHTKLISRCRAV